MSRQTAPAPSFPKAAFPHAEIGKNFFDLVPGQAMMEGKTQIKANPDGLVGVRDFFDRDGDGRPDGMITQLMDPKGKVVDRELQLDPQGEQKNEMIYLAGPKGRIDSVYEKAPDGRRIKMTFDNNGDGRPDELQLGDGPPVRLGRRPAV